jgi:hypothetical protein
MPVVLKFTLGHRCTAWCFNDTVAILRANGSGENPFCAVTALYGERSKETELLRNVRDAVLTQTPEGRECIKLYYAWSPVLAQVENGGTLLNKE